MDPKFKSFVRQELKKLGENIRTMHARQNKTYWDASKEKWGPSGSKTERAEGKKNIKFAQKATEIKPNKKIEHCKVQETEGSKEPCPAETEVPKRITSLTAEQRNKEPECGPARGDGSDNENTERVVAPEAGPGAPDNHKVHKDSDCATTSADSVVSKRSTRDKSKKKVKGQTKGATNPSRTDCGTQATSSKLRKGGSVKTNQ